MLHTAREQGVELQILTPHFYRWREDIPQFLDRREHSAQKLHDGLKGDLPGILIGAEVAYFHSMSSSDLQSLCIDGANGGRTLLVEMPFESWDREVDEELACLCLDRGYRVVLAHIERFLGYGGNRDIIDGLSNLPIVFQINAEAFLSLRTRKTALDFIRSGKPVVLASDAHNLSDRKPNLIAGRRVVEKKLGAPALSEIDALAEDILQKELERP